MDKLLQSRFEWLLRIGDTNLILAQRLGEWCGKGPALEEDMALTNTALDLLGQARLWLTYAGELEGAGRDEDQLAYLRDSRQFRNALLVERPNGDYAHTIMRQFYFDAWHHLALRELTKSTDLRVSDIAQKAVKEAAYHLRRSSDLVVRLGDGTEKSHSMLQSAADLLWPYTGELFHADDVDKVLAGEGLAPDLALLKDAWLDYVADVFAAATLRMPAPSVYMQLGGKQGVHSEQLSFLLAEMQVLQRTYPGATW